MNDDLPVALVTGGGRGIGRASALALAESGHRVAVLARSEGELAETVDLIARDVGDGDRAVMAATDVTDPEAVAAAVADVEGRWGRIDVLVNNAGVATPPSPVAEADVDAWWRLVEVNLRGPMLLCRYVLPGMIARGRGRVININSLVGVDARGAPASTNYGISKAGLFRLTNNLAAELEGTGVTVFDLSPGLVFTQMTDNKAFAGVPDEHWTSVEVAAAALVRIARGDLDALTGRFVHANDDLDEVIARAEQIVAADARILTMKWWGPDDPMAG